MVRSPALDNAERLLGYIAGSLSGASYSHWEVVCMTTSLVPVAPYAQGYVAGLVAAEFGVNLMPRYDATSLRPYSSVFKPFTYSGE